MNRLARAHAASIRLTPRSVGLRGLITASLLLGASACGWNYTPTENVLPGQGSASSDSDDTNTVPMPSETGALEDFPATYRFDCMDIQQLGDADDEVFQVATLQDTWANDIATFKLSILIELLDEDEAGGQATVQVRSGVGAGWAELCAEPSTISNEATVTYEPGVTKFEPSPEGAEGVCSQAADAGASSGTYTLSFGAEDVISIYAEDDDGTPFNCALDGGAPAIPIAGASATITMSEDRNRLAGTMTGCMTESAANQRCACLGFCGGQPNDACPGCPDGSVPLGLLLGGINSTPDCTELMGETAFDITLGFTATRLNSVPAICGG